jgi:uncharacterized protein (DUF58 family)
MVPAKGGLVDPHSKTRELIRQVRAIELKTRRIVDENLAGSYHSVFKGQGMEFDEVRAYQIGDDVRTIDWNVTAKMGEPFVKKFTEERELSVLVMVDMSGSSEFGSSLKSKRSLSAELTALVALSAIRNQDKVGCMIVTDRVETYIPPKKGKNHVLRLIREVLGFQPQSVGTNLGEALRFAAKVLKRKTVIFLISDFIDEGFDRPLAFLSAKHDVLAFHVTDQREQTPPNSGLFFVEDGETGEEFMVDFFHRPTRQAFEDQAKRFQDALHRRFRRAKVDHLTFWTDRPYESDLVRFFKRRELRR